MDYQNFIIPSLYHVSLLSEAEEHSMYQILFMIFPLTIFLCGEKFIALYNSSYMYLASMFGNGPQVSEEESFFLY